MAGSDKAGGTQTPEPRQEVTALSQPAAGPCAREGGLAA